MTSETLIPRVLWAQRKEVVYVTFEVFEVRDEKVELTADKVSFSGIRGSDGAKFEVSLELFASINPDASKITVGHRDVAVVLSKTEAGPFWPRLLKTTQKAHYVHTDFSKWKDEDEEDEEKESDMSARAGMNAGAGGFDMSQFGAGKGFDMSQFGAGKGFDMSQFGAGGGNFDMSKFSGAGGDGFDYSDEEEDEEKEKEDEENETA